MISRKIKILLALIAHVSGVLSTCTLRTNENLLLFKSIGNKKVSFKSPQVNLGEQDEVLAVCNEKITIHNNYNGVTTSTHMSVSCRGNRLYIQNRAWDYGSSLHMSCPSESSSLGLHVLNEALNMCENYSSLAFGMEISEKTIIKANVCFDLDEGQSKFLTYSTSDRNIYSETSVTNKTLAKQIVEIDEFLLPQSSSTKVLLNQNFTTRSILLDANLDEQITTNRRLVEVKFWDGLYYGNWDLFKQAYQSHVEIDNQKYEIHSATYGKLEVPKKECNKIEHIKSIPQYIWAYLKPSNPKDSEEGFVIVALNSPYYKVNETLDICNDICDEIEWLKDSLFERTRFMPSHGMMFCCDPEEVKDKLDFFSEQAFGVALKNSKEVPLILNEE